MNYEEIALKLGEISELLELQCKQQEQILNYSHTILACLAFAVILGVGLAVAYIILKPILIFWKGGHI